MRGDYIICNLLIWGSGSNLCPDFRITIYDCRGRNQNRSPHQADKLRWCSRKVERNADYVLASSADVSLTISSSSSFTDTTLFTLVTLLPAKTTALSTSPLTALNIARAMQ